MAATHTYVITSVTELGDVLTVTGTVDTIPSTGPIPVTVTCWVSAATAALATAVAFEAFIAPKMLALAFPTTSTPVTAPVTSFSQ